MRTLAHAVWRVQILYATEDRESAGKNGCANGARVSEWSPTHWLWVLIVIALIFGRGILRDAGDRVSEFGAALAESEPWIKVSFAILATLTVVTLSFVVEHVGR